MLAGMIAPENPPLRIAKSTRTVLIGGDYRRRGLLLARRFARPRLSQALDGHRSDDLLPPRTLRVVPRARQPAAGVELERLRAADRDERPADRVAAVGQRHQRTGHVAARAQPLDHRHAVDALG